MIRGVKITLSSDEEAEALLGKLPGGWHRDGCLLRCNDEEDTKWIEVCKEWSKAHKYFYALTTTLHSLEAAQHLFQRGKHEVRSVQFLATKPVPSREDWVERLLASGLTYEEVARGIKEAFNRYRA